MRAAGTINANNWTSAEKGTTVAVTIRDVANLAGVHISTVSRTFSAPHLVNEETRRRVTEAAVALRYQPNRAARGLITGRTYQLGLIVADIANPFFPLLIKAAQAEAARSDYGILIADTDESTEVEERLLRSLARQVDGIVLGSVRIDDNVVMEVAEERRLVVVNRAIEGVPAVLMDVAVGARAAMEHVLGLGHAHIAYVGGPSSAWIDAQLRATVSAACRAAGARLTAIGPYSPTLSGGEAAAARAVATGATAVLAFNDLVALGLLAGFGDAGVDVPGQVSLVGVDDILATAFTSPPLSTIAMPTRLAGQLAVDLLLRLLRGETPEERSPMIPTEFLLRGSVGPPPGRPGGRRSP